MSDRAVAEADLMTLLSGRDVCFSVSPDSNLWRARRTARSLMALGVELSVPSLVLQREDPLSTGSPQLPAAQYRKRISHSVILGSTTFMYRSVLYV